ncbi:MAG: TraB/GumN family protein [Chitinophagales bacterium]
MQKLFIFFTTLFFCLQGFAQQGILLKITPPGGTTSSYIFATFEHKEIVNYNFENVIEPVMGMVNTVVFDWLEDEAQRAKMMEIMQFKEDQNLKKIYDRDDNIRYELMVMDKLKGEVAAYAKTQPLHTLQLFRERDFGQGVEYQDNVIFQMALNASKPIISVLNPRSIEEIVYTMDFKTQAEILSNYVNNVSAFLTNDDENLMRYLNGDLQEIAINTETLQSESYINTFLNKKIELVFNKVVLLSAQQAALFVIDGELLGGSRGILKKLENENFMITPEYRTITKNANQENSLEETVAPDKFPTLTIQEFTPASGNVKIIYNDSLQNVQHEFIALYDPFNDLFDYATADTTFLKNWYAIRGSEGKCNMKIPVQAEWESTITPSPAGDIKSFSYSGNHARSDLFYSFGYSVYPQTFDAGNKTVFFNEYVKQQIIKLKGELLSQRLISSPEYVGREFTIVVSDSFFVRSKVFLKNNIVYQMLCGGPGNNAYGAFANGYFNSFRLESKVANNWYFYQNTFFSCNLPTPPLTGSQKISIPEGTLTLQTFTSEDYQEGISYLVSVYLYPPGYEFGNENDFLEELVKGAEKQYVGKAVKNAKVKKDGLNGRYVEMQLNNTKIYKIYFFYRGNAVFQYLAGGPAPSMKSENPNYFFDTFSFAIDEK